MIENGKDKRSDCNISQAFYHSFMDSIGAVYDWNALFDAFPGKSSVNLFRVIWLASSVGLWLWADRRERKTEEIRM